MLYALGCSKKSKKKYTDQIRLLLFCSFATNFNVNLLKCACQTRIFTNVPGSKASGFRRLWRSVQAQLAVVNTYSPINDFSLSSWIPSRLMFYGHSYFDPTRNMQAMFYLIFLGKLIFGNVSAFNGYIQSHLDHPWSHLGETQKLVGMQCCLTRPCGLGQRRHYYGPQ